MISIESKGSFVNTETWLKRITTDTIFRSLNRYGEEGCRALASATPIDSGLTASSWTFEVSNNGNSWEIVWSNTHIESGLPIAILLQYGHGTGTGGYVQGRDYINPAIKPVFDRIAQSVWEEVTRA